MGCGASTSAKVGHNDGQPLIPSAPPSAGGDPPSSPSKAEAAERAAQAAAEAASYAQAMRQQAQMAPPHSVQTHALHVNARSHCQGYKRRVKVDDDEVNWAISVPEYEPIEYTEKKVLELSPDPVEANQIPPEEWSRKRAEMGRRSLVGTILFNSIGRPINPMGRTGLAGRGSLFAWGPNFAVDPLITRNHPDLPGVIEVLVSYREEDRCWALPGGMLRARNSVLSQRLKGDLDKAKFADEFREKIRTSAERADQMIADKRVLSNDMGSHVEMKDPATGERSAWVLIHQGYVDDKRNTDNAWIESFVWHYHFGPLPNEDSDEGSAAASQLLPGSGYHWLTVDAYIDKDMVHVDDADDNSSDKLFANHQKFCEMAAQRLPNVLVLQVRDRQHTRLHQLADRSKIDQTDTIDALLCRVQQEQLHVTNLIDEYDKSALLRSLWESANKPVHNKRPPRRNDEERLLRLAFWRNRQNWSKHNLASMDIREMATLLLYTPPSYTSVLNQPLYLINLALCCANMQIGHSEDKQKKHRVEMNNYFFPADKSDCVSQGSKPIRFTLSSEVFDSGTRETSLDKLQILKRKLFPGPEGHGLPDGRTGYIEMVGTPIHAVPQDENARQLAGIHADALFFCFCPGVDRKKFRFSKAEEEELGPEVFADPFLKFLQVGSFVYFDFEYSIVQVSALLFGTISSAEAARNPAKARPGKIFYSRPSPLPPTAYRVLKGLGRWEKCSVPALIEMGFKKFAWITPSEFIGDHIFPKNGGFAYWKPSNPLESKFYAITSPFATNDDVPKQYRAPLHVVALTDAQEKLRHGAEARGETQHNYDKFTDNTMAAREASYLRGKASALGLERKLGFKDAAHLDKTKKHVTLVAALSRALEDQARVDRAVKWLKELPMWGEVTSAYRSPLHDELKALDVACRCASDEEHHRRSTTLTAEQRRGGPALANELEANDEDEEERAERLSALAKAAKEEGDDEADDTTMTAEDEEQLRCLFVEVAVAVLGDLLSSDPKWRTRATQRAEMHLRNVHYVLYEKTKVETVHSNDNTTTIERDAGNDGMTLIDFWRREPSRKSSLTPVEVAALRIYTSSTYELINAPLRDANSHDPTKPAAAGSSVYEREHPLALTTHHISWALKKLRTLHLDAQGGFKGRDLWRGMKDRSVNDTFMVQGGSESACMSTSSDINIVSMYAASSNPLLFRIKVDSPMDMGADIDWLSIYPSEKEVLYPPLSYLQPIFQQSIKFTTGSVITMKISFPS